MLWEFHINCQSVTNTMFGQANGTLKIVTIVVRVAIETQTGGDVRTFFGYDGKNKKLASIKKQMVSMS